MPFSRSLNPRRDHNVTLLNNEVINDAVLNAEFFSKKFTLSGLDNLQEGEEIAHGINPRFPYKIKMISIKPVEPVVKPAE